MTREQVMEFIEHELRLAEMKHPRWPTDQIHAAAIVAEEAGELVQAALDNQYQGGARVRMIREAAQTAAMGIRFLLNTDGGET